MKTKDEKNEVPSFDELVFENRNKEYGAYEIRRKYNITLVWAILVGAFCVSATVITPFVIKPGKVIVVDKPEGPTTYTIDNTITNIPIDNPPIEKPVAAPVPQAYVAPDVVDSLSADSKDGLKTAEDLLNTVKNDSVDKVITVAHVEVNPPIEDPYKVVDFVNVPEKPFFGTGGDNEFRMWIAKNIHYPEAAIDAQIQGKVFLQFVIEKDGSLSNVKVIRSVDPLLDKEAIRVLEQSPKWTPGKQQGSPVRVNYIFPIAFTLK